jgi:SAM-dependent methyltransferase
VIDYDREAASYDDTRGGPERAAAVAAAVGPLLTGTVLDAAGTVLDAGGTVLDVACGTGIVTALLADAAAPAGVGDVSAPAPSGSEAAAPALAGNGGPVPALAGDDGLASAVAGDGGLASAVAGDGGLAPAVAGDDGLAPAVAGDDGLAPAAAGDDGLAPAAAGDDGPVPALAGDGGLAPAPARDGGPARGSAGRPVLGVDRSAGMLAVAAGRLPGRVLLGDATWLPVASGSVGTVLMVWLLHLLSSAESEAALAEAVRVAAPGGRVITTVDKGAAYFAAPSDLREATAPWRRRSDATDRIERVTSLLAGHGLHVVGESTFRGIGQGRSPRDWRAAARAGRIPWARDDPDGVEAALAGLPDQDRPRPEPVYRLVAFSASGS